MLKAQVFLVPRAEFDPSAPGVRLGADKEFVAVALPVVDEQTALAEAEGDITSDKPPKKKGD